MQLHHQEQILFSKSPPCAQLIRFENTNKCLGGIFLKHIKSLFYPQGKLASLSIQHNLPSCIISIDFSTNSCAYLYGGFVMICMPVAVTLSLKKSYSSPVTPYPLLIKSVETHHIPLILNIQKYGLCHKQAPKLFHYLHLDSLL